MSSCATARISARACVATLAQQSQQDRSATPESEYFKNAVRQLPRNSRTEYKTESESTNQRLIVALAIVVTSGGSKTHRGAQVTTLDNSTRTNVAGCAYRFVANVVEAERLEHRVLLLCTTHRNTDEYQMTEVATKPKQGQQKNPVANAGRRQRQSAIGKVRNHSHLLQIPQ